MLLPLTVITVVTICCVLLETGAGVVVPERLVAVDVTAADDACCDDSGAADEDGA